MLFSDKKKAVESVKDDPKVKKLIGIIQEKLDGVEFRRPIGQIDVGAQFLGVKKHLEGYETIELGVSERMTLEGENPKLFITMSTRKLRDKEIENEEGEDRPAVKSERTPIIEHRVVIYLRDGYMTFQRHPSDEERRKGGRVRFWINDVPPDVVGASIEVLNATIPVIGGLFEPALVKKAAPVAAQTSDQSSTTAPAPAKSAEEPAKSVDAPPTASDPKAELAKLVQKAPDAAPKSAEEEPAKPKSKAVQLGKKTATKA